MHSEVSPVLTSENFVTHHKCKPGNLHYLYESLTSELPAEVYLRNNHSGPEIRIGSLQNTQNYRKMCWFDPFLNQQSFT